MKSFLEKLNIFLNYKLFILSNQIISLRIIIQLFILLILVILIGRLVKFICQRWLLEKM